MPRIGAKPAAPRWLPVSLLRPGTEFVMPPGGATAGGVFLEMCGDDAKVVCREHGGRERREFWSGAALVLPGNVLPADQLKQLRPAAEASERSMTQRDERRTNVLTRKEQKAIVAKINQRPLAAPPPQAKRAAPAIVGDEL